MKITNKIKLILRTISEFGMSKLEVEISRNQSALKRCEDELNKMDDDWVVSGATCCAGFFGGSHYCSHIEKIARIRKNLDRLILKNSINKVFI